MPSPELTGGAGFTFEDAVVACYLAALVGGTTAAGLGSRVVQRVAQQQADAGEPLDDVIVDAVAPADSSRMRLSLQVKRSFTISDAATNTDFREVIQRSWQTLRKPDFREHVDRVGAATGTISDDAYRNFTTVCEWARASESSSSFLQRFGASGGASQAHRAVVDAVRNCALGDAGSLPDDAVYRLFSHLVLIKFDLLHEGSITEADILASLQRALAAGQQGRAEELWRQLRQLARDGSGRREEFGRASVLRRLSGGIRFVGSPALAGDLHVLRESSRHWLAQQTDDIGGAHVDRTDLRVKLAAEMGRHRLTLIKGLPGTGKTVLLRDLLARCSSDGTTLLLTANRLSGRSWAENAVAMGLSTVAIEPLLVEVAATGHAVLFIDGLDRIVPEQRAVITDMLGQLLDSPALSEWRIVATARDAGIEPLRNWVPPSLISGSGVGYVDVENLSDDDATGLATTLPALRPLLTGGDERVRSLARRPFFASVLARGFSSAAYPAGFVPRSEVDLINAWWLRGGYDAQDAQTLARQRALIELAQRSAPDLGRNVRIRDLSPATQAVLPALQLDGLVQQVRPGLTAQFAHDIFFEWAFLHSLLDEGENWIAALTGAGEPPALARVVELLSQATYAEPAEWGQYLRALEAPALRPQWLRAWLVAPVYTPDFNEHAEPYTATLAADDHRLLGKLLVWMRAEKTTPNPLVLSGQLGGEDLTSADRIRFADLLGWPSDFGAWGRLLTWALDHIAEIPGDCLADLVALFQTWQVPLMDLPHPISRRIVEQCATWAHAIEDAHQSPRWRSDEAEPDEPAPRIPSGVDSELRSLVLRAARSFPGVVAAYLVKIEPLERFQESSFHEVMSHAPLLAQTHPELLSQVARRSFLTELPDDLEARLRRESRERTARIAAIRAKPEEQRTRQEKLALEHLPMSLIGSSSFSSHDWDRLSIGADLQGYFPASPLREPFHSLLTHAPAFGRALVRDLANHATLAWRQLHRHTGRGNTPVPLVLEFPWGRQEFWGSARHYAWSRGHGGPKALECAMMALEHWALAQLESGRPAGEVLQELLEGHSSIAVLSVAVLVALQSREVSRVSLPLVGSQRLWRLDLQRSLQEGQLQTAGLIGFDSNDVHRKAVVKAGGLAARSLEIRSLVIFFALGSDAELRAACRAALERFPAELELEYEEEAQSEGHLAKLRRNAELWAEFGRQENYVTTPIAGRDDVVGIELRSERHSAPDIQAARQHFEEISRESQLWMWVEKCFETASLAPELSLAEAVERAKTMAISVAAGTAASLMPDHAVTHGCIAGTAAVAICFDGLAEHTTWARATLDSYLNQAEAPRVMARSRISWHPKIFVARALAAGIRSGRENAADREALYRLVAHPLEVVSLMAIDGIASCWERDSHFAWCGFNLGLRLAQYRQALDEHRLDSAARGRIEEERRTAAVSEAMRELASSSSFPSWVQPMPSWTQEAPDAGDQHRYDDEEGWHRSDEIWLSDFASAVLQRVPTEAVMRSAARDRYVEALEAFVDWTLDTLNPAWRSERRQGRERDGADQRQWQRQLGRLLAGVAVYLSEAEFRDRLLGAILDQPDEISMRMLAPFSGALAASGILDALQIDPRILGLLTAVLDRALEHRDFRRSRYNDGRLSGFDLPELIKTLLFVAVEGANGATRFANGRWSDLPQVLPLVEKLVRQAGWMPYVADQFVKLCEQAGGDYPAEAFADLILAQMIDGRLSAGWKGTHIPAAVAKLVQAHSDRQHPLPTELARKLLQILDALVDLGDRRSAALQQSESFRGVRL